MLIKTGVVYRWYPTWMSRVTHVNESCRTYHSVMSRIWMSHVTHMRESYHTHEWTTIPHVSNRVCSSTQGWSNAHSTYEWVMSHIFMRHVTHMNESCHTYEWGMSHIGWVMSHIFLSHVAHMNKQQSRTTEYARLINAGVVYRSMSHMNESHHTYE